LFRACWWPAVAQITRVTGDLQLAEDAVQDAWNAALTQWSADGVPANPPAWLTTVARRKAIDKLRRDGRRPAKELAAMHDDDPTAIAYPHEHDDDTLSLIFMCCHPALDLNVRVPLALRSICGLATADIAALYLVDDATMAKRLVRARRKIRDSGIPFQLSATARAERLGDVLQVVYLLFTEGHRPSHRAHVVDGALCDEAIDIARTLMNLMPSEPEVMGLLALLLLTDARRPARVDHTGALVVLEEQDRSRWDRAKIDEGDRMLLAALATNRPGPYQLWAAIAACHSIAPSARETDWTEIAALYDILLEHEPSPIVEANRGVAIGMAHGPDAGLAILERLAQSPQLSDWPQLHMARADLYRRNGDTTSSAAAYQHALDLDPAPAERAFIQSRVGMTSA
jgi:RNA polymerase sigma-70 factor (ECF subfamily)